MGEYVALPEPPGPGYGPVKVYKMTKKGKKLPPDVHPERMKRGVHYRLKVISVEALREMDVRKEEDFREDVQYSPKRPPNPTNNQN